MVFTSSTVEVIFHKAKARNKFSFDVRNSPDPGLPENLRTSLFKGST